jgi:hypothetical protein
MAITYPLSLPTTIGIGEIELRANNVVGVSQSPFTYKQQVVQHQGQRWEASVSIPPVRKDLAEEWIAFLISLKGPVGTFYLGDPNMATPRGTILSGTTVTLDSAASAGDETVALTKSAGPAKSNVFLPGDYIQIGTGSGRTLHKVLNTVDWDANGDGTADIWPHIRGTVASGTSVVHQSTTGKFRLTSGLTSWSINNASTYGISFDAVEVI